MNKSYNKIYKKKWFIEKIKSQSKNVKLLVDEEWVEFSSYEKCDNFLNKWRGFTSTKSLKNVNNLCGYSVKFNC